MKNYEELLQNFEWKIKRNSIQRRDKHICTNCHNKSILIDSEKKLIAGYAFTNKGFMKILLKPFNSKEELNPNDIVFVKNSIYNNYFKDKPIFVYTKKSPTETNYKILSVAELLDTEIKIIYTFGLHVHHKYYQDELLPWEYPNSALITLCWICHENLHKDSKVPYYDKNGNLKKYLNPCYRCHGAGSFPEYNHVEAGTAHRLKWRAWWFAKVSAFYYIRCSVDRNAASKRHLRLCAKR
jgi:hypothetical protein